MNMTLIHYGLGGIIFLLVVTIILIVILRKNICTVNTNLKVCNDTLNEC